MLPTIVVSLLLFASSHELVSARRVFRTGAEPILKMPELSAEERHNHATHQFLPPRRLNKIHKKRDLDDLEVEKRSEAYIKCDGRYQFSLCGETECTPMGSVAAGTACVNGAITWDIQPDSSSTSTMHTKPTKHHHRGKKHRHHHNKHHHNHKPKTTSTAAPVLSPTSATPTSDAPSEPTVSSDPVQLSAGMTTSADQFEGFATYFYQNGAYGACGKVHADSDRIVALALARYGTGSNNAPDCGRQVKVTNTKTGASVVCDVADACPGCRSYDSLDLSVGAFTAIGSMSDGVLPIEWEFIN